MITFKGTTGTETTQRTFKGFVLLVACVVCVLSSACVATSNKITLPGNAKAAFPKDLKADLVTVRYEFRDQGGFTNRFTLTLSNIQTKMNPGVINAVTVHDTQLIKQSLESAAQLIGAIPK